MNWWPIVSGSKPLREEIAEGEYIGNLLSPIPRNTVLRPAAGPQSFSFEVMPDGTLFLKR